MFGLDLANHETNLFAATQCVGFEFNLHGPAVSDHPIQGIVDLHKRLGGCIHFDFDVQSLPANSHLPEQRPDHAGAGRGLSDECKLVADRSMTLSLTRKGRATRRERRCGST
jgi:hypothetical protein